MATKRNHVASKATTSPFHLPRLPSLRRNSSFSSRKKISSQLQCHYATSFGFPLGASNIAVDSVLHLLAVACDNGNIQIFGKPGVMFPICSGNAEFRSWEFIHFLPGQGKLITVSHDAPSAAMTAGSEERTLSSSLYRLRCWCYSDNDVTWTASSPLSASTKAPSRDQREKMMTQSVATKANHDAEPNHSPTSTSEMVSLEKDKTNAVTQGTATAAMTTTTGSDTHGMYDNTTMAWQLMRDILLPQTFSIEQCFEFSRKKSRQARHNKVLVCLTSSYLVVCLDQASSQLLAFHLGQLFSEDNEEEVEILRFDWCNEKVEAKVDILKSPRPLGDASRLENVVFGGNELVSLQGLSSCSDIDDSSSDNILCLALKKGTFLLFDLEEKSILSQYNNSTTSQRSVFLKLVAIHSQHPVEVGNQQNGVNGIPLKCGHIWTVYEDNSWETLQFHIDEEIVQTKRCKRAKLIKCVSLERTIKNPFKMSIDSQLPVNLIRLTILNGIRYCLFTDGIPWSLQHEVPLITVQATVHATGQVIGLRSFRVSSPLRDAVFACFPQTQEMSANGDASSNLLLFLLLEKEFLTLDLNAPNWPEVHLPYLRCIHSTPLTACQYIAKDSIGEPLRHSLEKLLPRFEKSQYLQGGEDLNCACSFPDVSDLIWTSHVDGSVKLWSIQSGQCISLLHSIYTSLLFYSTNFTRELLSASVSVNEFTNIDQLEFYTIGEYDPFALDPRIEIHFINWMSSENVLLIGGNSGQCFVWRINKSDESAECGNSSGDGDEDGGNINIRDNIPHEKMMVTCSIMPNDKHYEWSGYESMEIRSSEALNQVVNNCNLPTSQSTHAARCRATFLDTPFKLHAWLQLLPAARVTSCSYQAVTDLFAASTSHGWVIVNCTMRCPIFTHCNVQVMDDVLVTPIAVTPVVTTPTKPQSTWRHTLNIFGLQHVPTLRRSETMVQPTSPIHNSSKLPCQAVMTIDDRSSLLSAHVLEDEKTMTLPRVKRVEMDNVSVAVRPSGQKKKVRPFSIAGDFDLRLWNRESHSDIRNTSFHYQEMSPRKTEARNSILLDSLENTRAPTAWEEFSITPVSEQPPSLVERTLHLSSRDNCVDMVKMMQFIPTGALHSSISNKCSPAPLLTISDSTTVPFLIGTSSGYLQFYTIHPQKEKSETADQQQPQQQPPQQQWNVSVLRRISLKHAAPIVGAYFLHSASGHAPILSGDMNSADRLLIITECQVELLSLPQCRLITKYKITKYDSHTDGRFLSAGMQKITFSTVHASMWTIVLVLSTSRLICLELPNLHPLLTNASLCNLCSQYGLNNTSGNSFVVLPSVTSSSTSIAFVHELGPLHFFYLGNLPTSHQFITKCRISPLHKVVYQLPKCQTKETSSILDDIDEHSSTENNKQPINGGILNGHINSNVSDEDDGEVDMTMLQDAGNSSVSRRRQKQRQNPRFAKPEKLILQPESVIILDSQEQIDASSVSQHQDSHVNSSFESAAVQDKLTDKPLLSPVVQSLILSDAVPPATSIHTTVSITQTTMTVVMNGENVKVTESRTVQCESSKDKNSGDVHS